MESGCECDGNSRPSTVYDYFKRAFDRGCRETLPWQGDEVSGCGGLVASFSLELSGERIVRCSYKSSTCVTLVAFCELLSECTEYKTLQEGLGIDASYLVSLLSGVPAGKHDRAVLAIAALRSALKKTAASQNRSPTGIKGEKQ